VAAADKKRLEDELAEERRKAVEATVQFNTAATVGFSLYLFLKKRSLAGDLQEQGSGPGSQGLGDRGWGPGTQMGNERSHRQ
jgi:hypothetical protein